MNSEKINNFETWLNSFLNFEKLPQKNIFWLDTMEQLSSLTGNPEAAYKTIHVAGSKGKGSTSAMISSILTEYGLKTGLYTSPHIETFLERITENQNLLTDEIYEASAEELKNAVEKAKNEGFFIDRPVTWFELITLYSFLCFKNAGMDTAVYEVGLGGRLDATNIIKPEICCIGPIELEHTEFLGDTVEKIAEEKAGIIKENTPVIVASQIPSVKEVFIKKAKEKNAEIFFIDEEISNLKIKYIPIDGKMRIQNNTSLDKYLTKSLMEIEFSSPFFTRPVHAKLSLPGDFQALNAIMAAIAVKKAFPQIPQEIIETGLSKAFLPARFEILSEVPCFPNIPYLILDGAHTPRSIDFTTKTMKEVFNTNANFNLLFACAADKDVEKISELLSGKFQNIWLTKPGNVKQSDTSAMIEAFEKAGCKFDFNQDFVKQIEAALNHSNETKTGLLVTGSFYLVSEVKKILNSAKKN